MGGGVERALPLAGKTSFWPIWRIEVSFKPLASASFSAVVPFLRAILSRLSPARTV